MQVINAINVLSVFRVPTGIVGDVSQKRSHKHQNLEAIMISKTTMTASSYDYLLYHVKYRKGKWEMSV